LISIAVYNDYKGKGIASDLMKEFFDEMSKRGIESVKVTVGADNIRANEYYKKWGFEKKLEMEVHKGIKSNVYVKEK
jgi:ribosomal protein S18 acetylase RimI-like enzyme